MIRTLFPILLAGAAFALPPSAPGYKRHDDLFLAIKERRAALEAQERFESLPRMEKIVVLFAQGEESFERLKLTGENVVEEFLAWDKLNAERADEESMRIALLLPEALAKRFPLGAGVDKRDRYKVSYRLVKALADKYLPVRAFAIECLKKIYANSGRLYQPDANERQRKTWQSDWERYIKKYR